MLSPPAVGRGTERHSPGVRVPNQRTRRLRSGIEHDARANTAVAITGQQAVALSFDLAQAAAASPWTWEPRPDVWILMLGLVFGYMWAITRLRTQMPGPPPPPSQKMKIRWFAGVGVLWLALDWPLDRLGDEFLFSAHMFQFVVVTMVAAPLLVSGSPPWLQVAVTRPIARALRPLQKPVASLLIFQVVIVGTHLPWVVNIYTTNTLVHFVLHIVWSLAGMLFWLPVVGHEPMVRRPIEPITKVVYLIAATVVPSVPASFLTWAERPVYDTYTQAPRIWNISAVNDIQLAGAVMKVGAGAILWGFICVIFLGWMSQASRSRTVPIPPTPTPPPDASLNGSSLNGSSLNGASQNGAVQNGHLLIEHKR